MGNYIRWAVPCNFSKEGKQEPIEFDFTEHINAMFSNKVWEREYHYSSAEHLKSFKSGDIKSCKITIVPRILSGFYSTNRYEEILNENFGEIPDVFDPNNFSPHKTMMGLVIFNIECNYLMPHIEDVLSIHSFTSEFIYDFRKADALLNEIGAFLLSGLNLLFTRKAAPMTDEFPINNGVLQLVSGEKKYFHRSASSLFTHYVYIENTDLEDIEFTFRILCSVWHYNLWSLRRYLIAVESSRINMDKLLDLIYALEGLFKHGVSSDFIKTMCVVQFSSNKKDAKKLYSFINEAFKIRNEIVHGGITYSAKDKVKIEGKPVPVQDVYFEMKRIVGTLILRGVFKLNSNKEQKNLRFNADDMWDKIYKK